MIESNLFLLISVIFIILQIVIIFLFMNHLKFMRIFIEEMRRDQIISYKEISDIKKENNSESVKVSRNETYNLQNIESSIQPSQIKSSNDVVNDTNLSINKLKSSQVSKEELLEMLKGTEQVFANQVNIDTEKMFIDLDIDMKEK